MLNGQIKTEKVIRRADKSEIIINESDYQLDLKKPEEDREYDSVKPARARLASDPAGEKPAPAAGGAAGEGTVDPKAKK